MPQTAPRLVFPPLCAHARPQYLQDCLKVQTSCVHWQQRRTFATADRRALFCDGLSCASAAAELCSGRWGLRSSTEYCLSAWRRHKAAGATFTCLASVNIRL